ncbi:MAG: phosphomannomutase [Verrucomicrobiota bacterium]
MSERLASFKAYDIRGRVPDELNEDMAYKLGRAYAWAIKPQAPVAVGRDIRLSSGELATALINGLNDGGVDTRDIGLCGTEMVYYAAGRDGMGGGIMVTASHNPMDYNGMKLVRTGSVPISGDSGLNELEKMVRNNDVGEKAVTPGRNQEEDLVEEYVEKLLTFIDVDKLKPMKIVVNPGNGCAGPIVDRLAEKLPFEFIRINHQPDGTFPNGIPNPLLEENRQATAAPVKTDKAHLGIAWDGDFDRCFFFTENGDFADGYYMVGLFASHILKTCPGEKIIHDPRMTWNTIEMVKEAGGVPVQSKTGHAFVKERMRKENAVYGGEMSAHHYFRDFTYCDSGMIPWLLLTEQMSVTDRKLSDLIRERRARYPSSGEINSRVANAEETIEKVRQTYKNDATKEEFVDGLSMEFADKWRFNLRSSQTEPILRLNVEAKADEELMRSKTEELLALIKGD